MRNDVYNNRYHVPVISSPNPANETMMRDSVNIYVMINNEFIGHVGLVIGNGEDALLYDPAGSYTGCKNNQCEDGSYTLRGSGDFFQYPDFNWDDYLSYQLWDGDDIVIIEFVIPREQAEHITKLIYELGGANALFCATRINHVLKLSGGVFSNLDTPIYIRSPWELKKQLLDIYFPERGGIISSAY
ncbi:TPA: hypothetical protein ACKRF0_001116 [Proteus mirabilis]